MRRYPTLVSFVIPLYNEEEVLPALRERLCALRLNCEFEIVLIDDGSRDRTGSMLTSWAKQDSRVKAIRLSRNFGHQLATTAGLDFATGEVVVVMDGDLQDPPELAKDMIQKYRQGFDVVYGQRTKRDGETFFKRVSALLFYRMMKRYVHADLPENTGDFRLMSRPVVEALRELRESHRFLRGMISWLGFQQASIQFERPARTKGVTKFKLDKMFRFAFDAILSFSSVPLRIGIYLGLIVLSLASLYGIYAVISFLFFNAHFVPGWTSIVAIGSGIGGAILLCVGLIGEYVGRIYEEIKQRPLYIIRSLHNLKPVKREQRFVQPSSLRTDDVLEPELAESNIAYGTNEIKHEYT